MPRSLTRLHLRVTPRAARPGIGGRRGEAWRIRVAAPAEGGRANAAVLALLAEALGVPRTRLELVRGAGTREKLVVVDGLTASEAERRLAAAADLAGGRS